MGKLRRWGLENLLLTAIFTLVILSKLTWWAAKKLARPTLWWFT